MPITIAVRFTASEEFFCGTYLGYNNDDADHRVKENEPGVWITAETEACSKGETDVTFGQIPTIFYS